MPAQPDLKNLTLSRGAASAADLKYPNLYLPGVMSPMRPIPGAFWRDGWADPRIPVPPIPLLVASDELNGACRRSTGTASRRGHNSLIVCGAGGGHRFDTPSRERTVRAGSARCQRSRVGMTVM